MVYSFALSSVAPRRFVFRFLSFVLYFFNFVEEILWKNFVALVPCQCLDRRSRRWKYAKGNEENVCEASNEIENNLKFNLNCIFVSYGKRMLFFFEK